MRFVIIQFINFKRHMLDYFVFPVNFQDVQQQISNKHCVETYQMDLQEKQITSQLKRIDTSIFQNYEDISKHQNFDFLYNILKTFSTDIEYKSMKILEKLAETLHHIATIILNQCLRLSNQDSLQKLRVSYKMVIFLNLYFVTVVTKAKQKSSQADLLADAINKENKKKKNKTNDIQYSKSVIQGLKSIITLLRQTLDIDYKILWERKQIDQELFKRYTDVCVKVLQSSVAKDQQVINLIFYILQVIIRQKPQLFMNIQRVLINLVYESDMTDTLVQFFSRAQSPQLQRLCTQTIICVVLYLVQKNLSSEASSIKNTKQFLSKLSQKIPKMFYNNLSCFIRLYEHDSYILRNALSDILMNIIRFVFNSQQNQEQGEGMLKARDKFINTLIQRIYDKSSFCRWHTLGIFNTLAIEKAVPKRYLVMFLKAGVDRIKDISINTRKKSLQLINTIIDDVWPEDKQFSALNTIQQQKQMISMNKQQAESQHRQIVQIIQRLQQQQDQQRDNERFYTQLDKCQNQQKLLLRTIRQYEGKQMILSEEEEIIRLVQSVFSEVKILLSSKTDTDVLQTIRLFIKFYKRNLEYCRQSLPHIRLLVFSRQKKIKDQVLMTFTQLHLVNKNVDDVAKQLTNLFIEASPQDKSALQQILQIIISQSLAKNVAVIKPAVFSYLWSDFIRYQRQDRNFQDKRAILTILRIAYSKDPLMIRQQIIESFLNILKKYIALSNPDFYILKEILKIFMVQPGSCKYIQNNIKNFLLAIMCVLVKSQELKNSEWYSSCQLLLTCVYKMSQNPQKLCEIFLKKLHDNLIVDTQCNSTSVAHFLFALSHNCLKMLIHLDSLQNKIKTMKIKQDSQRASKDQQLQQQELDKVVGGAEAELQAKILEIQRLAEEILKDPFISRWVKVVESIATKLDTGSQLQIIAVLSYCKFMCISVEYCEANFNNLIKILNKGKIDSVIKNNIIIAIGDLLHRFPNIVQPYSPYLYQNLHDKDNRVRKTTLTVLTHLALNDMIKVKGDICDIAMLFQDDDPEIQSLVKQFFSEVNRKDPKYLFNIIPEALNRFSDQNIFHGNEKTFPKFLENITPLMEKNKYSESLVIKLCQRLSNSLNILEVRNAAHCLSQLNMNEKGLRKMIECFPDFKKTLQTPQVMASFKNLVTKLKKSSKNDIKNLIQELQQKILHSNEDMFNADQIKKRNQKIQKKQPRKKNQNKNNTGGTSSNSRKKNNRGRKKQEVSDDQMEIEDSSQVVSQRQVDADAAKIIQRIRPQRNVARKQIIIEQSQSEQQYEEDQIE